MPLRHCATKGCQWQAINGSWCLECQRETDDHRWEDNDA